MEPKTITVGFWHSTLPNIKYKDLEEFPYSMRKRNSIINHILSAGYSVMIRPLIDNQMIWIDNGRFGQR